MCPPWRPCPQPAVAIIIHSDTAISTVRPGPLQLSRAEGKRFAVVVSVTWREHCCICSLSSTWRKHRRPQCAWATRCLLVFVPREGYTALCCSTPNVITASLRSLASCRVLLLLVGCLTSKQRASVPLGRTCLHNCYVLSHWDRNCRSNLLSQPVTEDRPLAKQSQRWPDTTWRSEGLPLEY